MYRLRRFQNEVVTANNNMISKHIYEMRGDIKRDCITHAIFEEAASISSYCTRQAYTSMDELQASCTKVRLAFVTTASSYTKNIFTTLSGQRISQT